MKNKKFNLQLLIWKLNIENFDFELWVVTEDFFTEMKYYTVQNYLKRI